MARRLRAGGLAVAASIVALGISGCGLFFPLSDEEFAPPSPLATYRTGLATLTLEDGTKVVLDQVNAGPHLWSTFGADVRWFGGEGAGGWNLRINGAGVDVPFGGAFATFDRVSGGRHWTTSFSNACDLEVGKADRTGIRGTASCEGLRWYDALDAYAIGSGEPRPVPGEPRFDVTVTFEAAP